jgi:hypothetical protein
MWEETSLKELELIYEGKIHKFPYLNINVCEVIHENWEVILLESLQ